jgi:hypothetical protein
VIQWGSVEVKRQRTAAVVDSSSPIPIKNGGTEEGVEGRDVKYRRTVFNSLRGEKAVTVGTTASGHLDACHAARNKLSGMLKLTGKSADTQYPLL